MTAFVRLISFPKLLPPVLFQRINGGMATLCSMPVFTFISNKNITVLHREKWRMGRKLCLCIKGMKKYGFVVGYISVGICFLQKANNEMFRPVCNQKLQQIIPPWILLRADCEDGSVVIRPAEHCQQLMEWGTLSKLIITFRIKLLLFYQVVKLSLLFGPLFLVYPLTLFSSNLYSVWLKAIFYAVQSCGPIYIKLGQWASTRRDLFTAEFCEVFSQLHTYVQPHGWRHTEQALCKAYGKQWHEVLKIDKTEKPLGSGCVAQVYKGYIHIKNMLQETRDTMGDPDSVDSVYFRDGLEIHSLRNMSLSDETTEKDGDKGMPGPVAVPFSDDPDYVAVAVKVLHPNIREQFSLDLKLMYTMASFLETVFPSLRWVNLTDCVQEFSVSMTKQMDMIHEAHCLKRFYDDFADVACIRIPVPIMSFVRRNILVESFEEGQPIGEFLVSRDSAPKGLLKKLADIGVDALLQMVFVKNFVHGDLHPGNILVQNADSFQLEKEDTLVMVDVGDVVMTIISDKECPVRLVLLDCGITASLDKEDRDKFRQVFTAVVKGQGEVVADLFLQKSQHVECENPQAFRQDMADIVTKAKETNLQLSKIKVSELLSEVFTVLSRHRVKLESNFITIILAIGILEGLGRSLDPEMNILNKASTVLLGEVFRK